MMMMIKKDSTLVSDMMRIFKITMTIVTSIVVGSVDDADFWANKIFPSQSN